jgi:HEPN domain-containing protein
LNKLYIESRYPSSFGLLPYGKPTLEDAKKFYEFANEVFDKVCEILGVDRSEIIQMELKK